MARRRCHSSTGRQRELKPCQVFYLESCQSDWIEYSTMLIKLRTERRCMVVGEPFRYLSIPWKLCKHSLFSSSTVKLIRTPMTAYNNSVLSDWQWWIANESTVLVEKQSKLDVSFSARYLWTWWEHRESSWLETSCRVHEMLRWHNPFSLHCECRWLILKRDEQSFSCVPTPWVFYVERVSQRCERYNSGHRHSRINCSAPWEHERVIPRYADWMHLRRDICAHQCERSGTGEWIYWEVWIGVRCNPLDVWWSNHSPVILPYCWEHVWLSWSHFRWNDIET